MAISVDGRGMWKRRSLEMKMSTSRETEELEGSSTSKLKPQKRRQKDNVPGAHWLSTFTTLCHDHQAFPQMNPRVLTEHPVSTLIQILFMEQLLLLGNVKNPSLGSGI